MTGRRFPIPPALRRAGLVAAACLMLAGCESELYSNLSEVEANQMLAVLMSNGIKAGKTAKGKDGFTVTVEDRDMLRAITLLTDRGFPKNTRESIGKVFQKSGIMSSPFEERVRYIYALGEEVAQTLSQVDGVVAARVHIVLPDAPQLGQTVKPSSAAVFIKHQPGVDLDFFVPQIRRLVSSAIEGLEYSAVTVVLAEAQPTKLVGTAPVVPTVQVLPGLSVRDTDTGRFWQLFYGVLALVVLLLGGLAATGALLLRGRFRRRRAGAPELAALPVVEPS
ncbi:type III secretion system inner membrane ring lipoprotein SctJ [uncultured Methylobacterium sp.]|uniref:type III secretion system inner membrane ring lipoprotein SctJ n=1 Tax=uncultured Methylobacterium sp. TaxID=157278 RepID=UPI0026221D43|nr:type III secretion inner membrane ring lipoprotein SctJ [uncultured Methylobacterium sp.]